MIWQHDRLFVSPESWNLKVPTSPQSLLSCITFEICSNFKFSLIFFCYYFCYHLFRTKRFFLVNSRIYYFSIKILLFHFFYIYILVYEIHIPICPEEPWSLALESHSRDTCYSYPLMLHLIHMRLIVSCLEKPLHWNHGKELL